MQLRVFTSFSGYDSQCLALSRLAADNPGFSYELVGWSEIDKYAIQAHNALFPQWADRNYGDITRIDWSEVPDFDLFTYSSPCQDFSQAGKQAGGEKGSGTRSSLLWECERAIIAKRPRYLLMENVAALVSGKFIRLFNRWQLTLERYGYKNFAKVMNAKHYGVLQNRERIFMVSILNESARYEFPKPFALTQDLKDVLEKDVDESFYTDDRVLLEYKPSKITEPVVLGWTRDKKGNVVKRSPARVANAVTSGKRDNTQNYVLIPNASKDGYIPMELGGVCDLSHPGSKTWRGRVQEGGKVTPALTCHCADSLRRIEYDYRIRRLTPRECFRLMDLDDMDIDKIQAAGISNSQQYKMAGNSIVVACLYYIFDKLFVNTETTELTLF